MGKGGGSIGYIKKNVIKKRRWLDLEINTQTKQCQGRYIKRSLLPTK